MTKLPGVFAPFGSGMSQADMDALLKNGIVDRVHEQAEVIVDAANKLKELADEFITDDSLDPKECALRLRSIDDEFIRLDETRRTMQDRLEALQSLQLRPATDAEPLSLSA